MTEQQQNHYSLLKSGYGRPPWDFTEREFYTLREGLAALLRQKVDLSEHGAFTPMSDEEIEALKEKCDEVLWPVDERPNR